MDDLPILIVAGLALLYLDWLSRQPDEKKSDKDEEKPAK